MKIEIDQNVIKAAIVAMEQQARASRKAGAKYADKFLARMAVRQAHSLEADAAALRRALRDAEGAQHD